MKRIAWPLVAALPVGAFAGYAIGQGRELTRSQAEGWAAGRELIKPPDAEPGWKAGVSKSDLALILMRYHCSQNLGDLDCPTAVPTPSVPQDPAPAPAGGGNSGGSGGGGGSTSTGGSGGNGGTAGPPPSKPVPTTSATTTTTTEPDAPEDETELPSAPVFRYHIANRCCPPEAYWTVEPLTAYRARLVWEEPDGSLSRGVWFDSHWPAANPGASPSSSAGVNRWIRDVEVECAPVACDRVEVDTRQEAGYE